MPGNYRHPKAVRRHLLRLLYDSYMRDPLKTLEPEVFLDQEIGREDLLPNMHYLHDRGLVEMMTGYASPMFTGVRIRPAGIDLVENPFVFDREFPPAPGSPDMGPAELPRLLEALIEEADLCALEGGARKALIRDLLYLRDEAGRPASEWRPRVMTAALDWVEEAAAADPGALPSLPALRAVLDDAAQRGAAD